VEELSLNHDNLQLSQNIMNFIRLISVFLSFLLISAHFQRAGYSIAAIMCLLAPGLLYFTRPWSVRVLQILLGLVSLEWLRTLVYLVQLRQDLGLPWVRLAIILTFVALFTAASALVFRHKEIQKKYNPGVLAAGRAETESR
jgi:hypothetical protein